MTGGPLTDVRGYVGKKLNCMPRGLALLLIVFVLLCESQTTAPESRLGFSGAALTQERKDEAAFTAELSTDSISALHLALTKRPHMAGTPASNAVADMLRKRLAEAGLETEVHEFEVYLSTPQSITIELVEPSAEVLSVREPANPMDPDSANPELGPAFVAYSASGAITAPVVYVNYGLPPDYDQLAAAGVDVKGKIVMARYAKSHRAVKIHTAEERGAAAIIIYSDPADDGYAKGLVWPEGPWRADFMMQRGNGKYSWFWHGDPLSPGVAARSGAAVLEPATAPTLPKIPAVVLSSKEASKILAQLRGPAVPAGFQGALPFTYRLGPGPAVVKLDVRMDAGWRTIHDVIGRLRGKNPERWVVLGTHHDAWTFGGMDPAAEHRPYLKRRGRWGRCTSTAGFRTVPSCSRSGMPKSSDWWDQPNTRRLSRSSCARRPLPTSIPTCSCGGSSAGVGRPHCAIFWFKWPRMFRGWLERAGSTMTGGRRNGQKQPAERRRRGPQDFEVELAALGSGADFVAFQDYLGLPTLSMQFDFDGSYGTYHSNYDSRYFVEHFSDPGFQVARTMAQMLGLAAMRLGDAQVLPFRYSHYARKISEYLDSAASWSDEPIKLDLDASKTLAKEIEARAAALEHRADADLEAGTGTDERRAALNDQLAHLEQTLLDESAGPAERWYRHVIYGWNIYSLYAGQPLPGLAEAIRLKDPARIARETARIESALRRMRAGLDR